MLLLVHQASLVILLDSPAVDNLFAYIQLSVYRPEKIIFFYSKRDPVKSEFNGKILVK